MVAEQIVKAIEKELRQRGIDIMEMIDKDILENELRPALIKKVRTILSLND